ncbi:MAG TPA: YihY/virulence factor BrkB family protein [Bacteroidales bacterium]|nr:YihY/virulence factor BrkB family protein [Bacteroidales bacterium]
MTRLTQWIRDRIKYLTEDIWHIPLGELPRRKTFLIKEIRILVLAFRGFRLDKIQLRASALTYNTLLSIVPVVAIAFGIAKGFGFEKKLEAEIMSAFQGQQEVMDTVLRLARNFLSETSGGFIAVIGLGILLWSVMQVLDHIEKSFNHIWQINKSRPWVRKFTDYISIMIFAPLLLIVSGSLTVYITTRVSTISDEVVLISTLKPALMFLLKLVPYFVIWIVFTLLYMVMPNTRVKFRSALVAGIIAGTMFQVTQFLYINFQIGVSKYNALYGSFAAFPLFIIWMQISWLVVLLGAELSFANQNVDKYEFEYQALKISHSQRRVLILMILNIIVKRFKVGDPPVSAGELSKLIQIPVRIGREILYELGTAGLVTEINVDQPRERLYQPSMDISNYKVSNILTKLDDTGSDDVPVLKNAEYRKIIGLLDDFGKRIEKADSNLLLADI